MKTLKSYTDIEQSKKLAEILPLESADMNYWCGTQIRIGGHKTMDKDLDIPCWSLTALLDLCPTINGKQPILTRGKLTSLWYCYYEDEIDTQTYDNPIDACYEMITRLNELNLL